MRKSVGISPCWKERGVQGIRYCCGPLARPTISASGWGGQPVIAADLHQHRHRKAAVAEQFLAVAERHPIVGPAVQNDRASLHTVLAVPHFFPAGPSSTSRTSPLWMFMATAPPLDEPTTTSGWCLSNSAWAVWTASFE